MSTKTHYVKLSRGFKEYLDHREFDQHVAESDNGHEQLV